MIKTFYIANPDIDENRIYKYVNVYGDYICEYRNFDSSPTQALIEDNEENRDWILIEVLKGKIDINSKIIFDADNIINDIVYDRKFNMYF